MSALFLALMLGSAFSGSVSFLKSVSQMNSAVTYTASIGSITVPATYTKPGTLSPGEVDYWWISNVNKDDTVLLSIGTSTGYHWDSYLYYSNLTQIQHVHGPGAHTHDFVAAKTDEYALRLHNSESPYNISYTIVCSHPVATQLFQVTAKTFDTQNKIKTIFYWNETVRIGAKVTQGYYPISKVKVTIRDPADMVLVKNASMTYVSGIVAYNYRYNYKMKGAAIGNYSYIVYAQDAGGNWQKASGSFIVHRVYTTSNGPWSVTRGHHYNATLTVHVLGVQVSSTTTYIDIPKWHAIVFAYVNGISKSFTVGPSPRTGYMRVYIGLGLVGKDTVVQIKLTIAVEMSAETGSKMVYYYAKWKTTEGFYYTETTRTTTVTVA